MKFTPSATLAQTSPVSASSAFFLNLRQTSAVHPRSLHELLNVSVQFPRLSRCLPHRFYPLIGKQASMAFDAISIATGSRDRASTDVLSSSVASPGVGGRRPFSLPRLPRFPSSPPAPSPAYRACPEFGPFFLFSERR